MIFALKWHIKPTEKEGEGIFKSLRRGISKIMSFNVDYTTWVSKVINNIKVINEINNIKIIKVISDILIIRKT